MDDPNDDSQPGVEPAGLRQGSTSSPHYRLRIAAGILLDYAQLHPDEDISRHEFRQRLVGEYFPDLEQRAMPPRRSRLLQRRPGSSGGVVAGRFVRGVLQQLEALGAAMRDGDHIRVQDLLVLTMVRGTETGERPL